MLDAFSDEEITAIKALADKVLKCRDDGRKAKAIEDAIARLAEAGLKPKDLIKAKIRSNKGPVYKGGHSYQHPTNKTQVWAAKGKKPRWLIELEADGGKAVEVPPAEVRKAS